MRKLREEFVMLDPFRGMVLVQQSNGNTFLENAILLGLIAGGKRFGVSNPELIREFYISFPWYKTLTVIWLLKCLQFNPVLFFKIIIRKPSINLLWTISFQMVLVQVSCSLFVLKWKQGFCINQEDNFVIICWNLSFPY